MIYESASEVLAAARDRAWNHEDPRVMSLLAWLSDMGEPIWDDAIPTAAIRRSGARYRLLLGPRFVRQHLRNGSDALFLVLHELSHRVRGDLLPGAGSSRTPHERGLWNLSHDLMLNVGLLREFFPAGGVELLRRYYRVDRFPENLLIPPGDLDALAAHDPTIRALRARRSARPSRGLGGYDRHWLSAVFEATAGRHAEGAARIYRRIWFGVNTRTDEVFESLAAMLPVDLEWSRVRLLGDHTAEGERLPGDVPGRDALGAIDENDDAGAGPGGEEDEHRITPTTDARSRALFEAIRVALDFDPRSTRNVVGTVREPSVIPSPARRALALAAGGTWPGFFEADSERLRPEETNTHVYLDFSGSTAQSWPFLLGLVLHLGDRLGRPVHGFSTTVTDLGDADLRAGRIRTTGGTSLDCVVEHAREHGFRRVVMLTDGDANLTDFNAAALSAGEPELYLILENERQRGQPITDLARRTWTLDEAADAGSVRARLR